MNKAYPINYNSGDMHILESSENLMINMESHFALFSNLKEVSWNLEHTLGSNLMSVRVPA